MKSILSILLCFGAVCTIYSQASIGISLNSNFVRFVHSSSLGVEEDDIKYQLSPGYGVGLVLRSQFTPKFYMDNSLNYTVSKEVEVNNQLDIKNIRRLSSIDWNLRLSSEIYQGLRFSLHCLEFLLY